MSITIDTTSTESLGTIFNLNPDLYNDIRVETLPLSVRIINCLMRHKATTLSEVLMLSPSEMVRFRNWGQKCTVVLGEYLSSLEANGAPLQVQDTAPQKQTSTKTNRNAIQGPIKDRIVHGNFSLEPDNDLSPSDVEVLNLYREAYEVLGQELVAVCIDAPDVISPLIHLLTEYSTSVDRHNIILEWLSMVPADRQSKQVAEFINVYTDDEDTRARLMSFFPEETSTFSSLRKNYSCINAPKHQLYQLERFLRWSSYDLREEIEALLAFVMNNERTQLLIKKRAQKYTLEQVGSLFGITRERVRQLELKAKHAFNVKHAQIKILAKIAAEKNGAAIVTPADIAEYCPNYTEELLYFLRDSNASSYFAYDKNLDIFVAIGDSIRDRAVSYVDMLPDIFNANKLPEILLAAKEEYDLPEEITEKAIEESYQLTGDVYHKTRLSLARIYMEVMAKHYPDGLHVYDPKELERFRQIIADEFGDVDLPANNRALSARLASICILCGKGKYRPKQKNYIPSSLAKKIYNYIMDTDSPIFLTNTLFSIFGDELRIHGIDNKYYLQGVLRELYEDKLIFSRDYISKDPSVTSLYSSIIAYIKEFQVPIAKDMLRKKFPAVPDNVFLFATEDPLVLNYYGQYLHSSKLDILPEEKEYLGTVLQNLTADGEAHHGEEVFKIVMRENPSIFTRNGAMFPFPAFSILQFLFQNEFQFSRPWIAPFGVVIERAAEQLHEYIYGRDEVTLTEIRDFAYDVHFTIYSLPDLVKSCNDRFLLINGETLLDISQTGIDDSIAKVVENQVVNAIDEATPLSTLLDVLHLPAIRVPWTEWLVYSVLQKWSKKVEVYTSTNQLRNSVPMVTPLKDAYEHNDTVVVEDSANTANYTPDDFLDDLDNLLADILDDEFMENEPWDLEI